MRKKNMSVLGVLLLVVGLAACGQDDATNSDQPSIEQGEEVANTSCINCHGGDLTGQLGPDLHKLSVTEEELVEILIKGKGAMPPGTAPDHEEDVAAYLMTIQN